MDGIGEMEGFAPGPDGSLLRFGYNTERNERASVAHGRAIFDTILYVDVVTPGQKASTPRYELERIWSQQSMEALGLRETSKRGYKYAEFAEQVEKFKRSEQMEDMGGTPLKAWPRIDRSLMATLQSAHIYTVEQLAQVADSNLQFIGMGAMELRAQAQAFLNTSAGGAQVSQLTDKVIQLTSEVNRLNAELQASDARNRELQLALHQAQTAAGQVPPAPQPVPQQAYQPFQPAATLGDLSTL